MSKLSTTHLFNDWLVTHYIIKGYDIVDKPGAAFKLVCFLMHTHETIKHFIKICSHCD